MVTNLFPTLKELLVPNFNFVTIIGVLAIIIGLVIFFVPIRLIPKQKYYAIITSVTGIILVWGFSILQDFLTSTGGILIFWLTIITIFVAIFLFSGKKKSRNGGLNKLF